MSYNQLEFNNIEMLKPLKDMHISFISMYVSIVSLNIYLIQLTNTDILKMAIH